MDVKQVPPTTTSRVTSGTEARNDEREQARLMRTRKDKKKNETTPPPPTSGETLELETPSLESQLLDSNKVVELLSHRTTTPQKATYSRRSPFSTPAKASNSDGKKLDKQY